MQCQKLKTYMETGRVVFLPERSIHPNPAQPRRIFRPEALTELSDSIRQHGILQPLSVRRTEGGYELIAGERRLRAARMAGLTDIPCILMQMNDRESEMAAMVENLQRQDLDFIEEAQGIDLLLQQWNMSQEQVAKVLGKSQSGVANKLVPVYHELAGKTWGIIGCGNIGRQVAKVAEAFGCRVIASRRSGGATVEEVCRESDIITIHTPLNDSTRGLISREMIALMKKDIIIANAARGAVTDERAIADAIKEGRIGAFGSDVFSVEPFGEDHPFYRLRERDDVCFTPHMAWGSIEARERCLSEIILNIEAFLRNERRNRLD